MQEPHNRTLISMEGSSIKSILTISCGGKGSPTSNASRM
jgi:hypothetical protein